nr:ribonuclease H-like domain-containing protein [Tanacetum cinerariifolium]
MSYLSKSAHSTVKRPIHKKTAFNNSNVNQIVNTVRSRTVNTARPKVVVNAIHGNVVKALACWVWKSKTKVIDHVSKHNSASITLKKFDYVNAQGRSKSDKGVINSGCSRHITGNMSHLIDYEEIDGGYVAFRGNPKGGKITSKCTMKTGENCYWGSTVTSLVDGKKVIITESTVRRDLQPKDAEGVDCLPNAAIFEQLTLIWVEKGFSKRETPLFPTMMVQNPIDEAVNEEMNDSLERAATSASSLEAKQDSGGGPRCQKTIGDTIAQTRVKKLEKKQRSRTHKLKRLYKVSLTARVESSDDDDEDLSEDASKQGRISDIDADEGIILVSTHDDAEMFDVDQDLSEVMEKSSKRVGTELEQESSKKQKIDDDKETAKLKQLANLLPDEEGVAIDVIPLVIGKFTKRARKAIIG